MNNLNSAVDSSMISELKSRKLWLPVAVKWGVALYWYGTLAIMALALVFFAVVGSMTSLRFPFPFSVPVSVTFPAMDSLKNNHPIRTDPNFTEDQDSDVSKATEKSTEEQMDELDAYSFTPFALSGDLMFPVPLRRQWPFLMMGFITPMIIVLGIAFNLRRIFMSLSQLRPFDTANIRRVKIIGWLVVALDPLEFLVNYWSASNFLPQVADIGLKMERALHLEFQSILIGVLILALAHVFEYGARLQKDQELTI